MKHRNTNSRTARFGAVVLTNLMMAFAASVALADEAPAVYQMFVISDEAEGELLVAGNYAEAVESIQSSARTDASRFSRANNLCVGLTMTARFSEAEAACDKALSISRRGMRFRTYTTKRGSTRDYAAALSNRGVMRAVNGDEQGAREDFSEVMRLRTDTSKAEANLAKLESVASLSSARM